MAYCTFVWPCIVTNFFIIKPTNTLISQIYFGMKLYMFRIVRLSIIRSLFTVQSAMLYVIQVCRQLSSRTRMELQFHPGPARKLSTNLYEHIPLLSVQWINSWWWTNELSETCTVSGQNKFVKLVHLLVLLWRDFRPVSEQTIKLSLNTFGRHLEHSTTWFKYDRDWFVCKQAALRSSCATLREWSHKLHPPSCSG